MTPYIPADYKLAARPGKCKKSDGSKIANKAECEKACSILYGSFKVGFITWYQHKQKQVGCLVSKKQPTVCQWANFKGGRKHKLGSFRAVCKGAAPTADDATPSAPIADDVIPSAPIADDATPTAG